MAIYVISTITLPSGHKYTPSIATQINLTTHISNLSQQHHLIKVPKKQNMTYFLIYSFYCQTESIIKTHLKTKKILIQIKRSSNKGHNAHDSFVWCLQSKRSCQQRCSDVDLSLPKNMKTECPELTDYSHAVHTTIYTSQQQLKLFEEQMGQVSCKTKP